MARITFEDFGDEEVARIYMAAALAEARRVEKLLTQNGIEYAVEVERYLRYILGLFPSEHAGAAFYVAAGQADFCRRILQEAGLEAGMVDEALE